MTYDDGMREQSALVETPVAEDEANAVGRQEIRAGETSAAVVVTSPLAEEVSDKVLSVPVEAGLLSVRQRVFPYLIVALLLAFGSYQAILYYGHQVVPNPDFPGFLRVGRDLLSFEMPSSFKRAPVLGILQVGLSRLVGGPHAELTAGWLLNAILHALSLPALWLVARRFLGRGAGWLVLLTALNPWVLRNVPDPIAETTLHFFIVVTFCAIFARSRWRYVLAAVATMVRYDAAALIVVAFFLDMVRGRSSRQRLLAIVGAALACVPLALWMLGTILRFSDEGSTHYLKELGTDSHLFDVAVRYIRGLWVVTTSPLFEAPPSLMKSTGLMLSRLANAVFLAGFCIGVGRCFVKRHWEGIGLLLFLGLYLLIHSLHSFVLPRFCSTVSWVALLMTFWGLQSLWSYARSHLTLTDRDIRALQLLGGVALSLWALDVARVLPLLAEISVDSATVPAGAVALAGLFVACDRWGWPRTPSLGRLLLLAAVCGMIVSNQYALASVVGDGQENVEFKHLADWCRDNTEPGDKIVCTYGSILNLYLPERQADFIHPRVLKGETLEAFTAHCRTAGVDYIAWDSRLGNMPADRYHGLYGLDVLTDLARPENVGPYEFVTQIKTLWGRYINVFYLCPLDATNADL